MVSLYLEMKKVIIYIGIIFSLWACQSTKEIKDGSLAFQLKKYQLAKKLLPQEIATAKGETQVQKAVELAESYKAFNDYENALKYYDKAIELGAQASFYKEKALLQKQLERYTEAIETFKIYKTYGENNLWTRSEISICKKAIEDFASAHNMKVENMEKMNTSASDFSPFVVDKHTILYSSSRANATGSATHPWNGEKNSDIFQYNIQNKKVEAFDTIVNTFLPEANLVFNPDKSVAYFTRCDFSDNPNQNGYCALFKMEKDGDTWYPPEKLELFADTINCGHPFVSADGKRLYFSADAPIGYGGNDIYFVTISKGEYGFPINAGYAVNTAEDELFPTTDQQGNLYFSSKGRTGFGGLDIFKATPQNNGFATVKQLPYPINTGADDFGLIFTKEFKEKTENGIAEEGYFSSNRKGGKGSDDIYYYKKELHNTFALQIYVQEKHFADSLDNQSEYLGLKALPQAKVELIKLKDKATEEQLSDAKALAHFDLKAESNYKVLVSKPNYFAEAITISTQNLKDLRQVEILLKDTVLLNRIYPEKEIVINNIYYDLDKATLRPESIEELDKLYSFFENNSNLKIEIGSHTDSRGSDAYNLELSQRRAQSVVDYLVSKGIKAEQLSAKGYGETKILNGCTNGVQCTEDQHQANRRTSFRVIF